MFGILTWIKLGAVVVFALLLWWAYESVQHWHNAAWKDENVARLASDAKVTKLEGEKAAAVAENSRVRVAWAADSIEAQKEAIKVKHETENTFSALANRARSLAGSRTVVVAADTVELFRDTADAANATRVAPAAAGSDARADSVPVAAQDGPVAIEETELRTFVVAAGMAYADALGQFHACVRTYARYARSIGVAP